MQTLEDDDAVIELLEDSGEASNGQQQPQQQQQQQQQHQELATKRMLRDERLCHLFGLALTEKIVKSFPCFLVAEILIQGTMVVTERHVCFYSNIPGLRRTIKIRFADIVRLSKEKVYAFFPTGIGVHSSKEKTVFSYVTSRDKLLQFLRSRWENYSEVDEDFCSSVRGSSIDDAQIDGQTSSREASVLNDEDSGILVAPSLTATTAATPLEVQTDETEADSEIGDPSLATPGMDSSHPRVSSSPPLPAPSVSWSSLPSRHILTLVASLVLLCAIVIVYLSYRLNSLQEQLLLILSMRSGHGQSEMNHLQHKLGGIVETLGGLQEKLGSLRHLLHSLHPVENPR